MSVTSDKSGIKREVRKAYCRAGRLIDYAMTSANGTRVCVAIDVTRIGLSWCLQTSLKSYKEALLQCIN